jgi:hypothetical protein
MADPDTSPVLRLSPYEHWGRNEGEREKGGRERGKIKLSIAFQALTKASILYILTIISWMVGVLHTKKT